MSYVQYIKNEDGTVSRVPIDKQTVIADKEAEMLAMYNEIQKLKEQ